MHDFSELSGWHWHGFYTLLCFPGPLALHSLLYSVWMSLQKEPLWRVRAGRDTGSASVPLLGASLHTSLCVSEMWQEHAGDSLPFLWHVKAGLQVLGLGEGYKRHGFKALGCLGWDLVGKLMPQFSLCCWCQGHCFLPCDSALKDLTVEFH